MSRDTEVPAPSCRGILPQLGQNATRTPAAEANMPLLRFRIDPITQCVRTSFVAAVAAVTDTGRNRGR